MLCQFSTAAVTHHHRVSGCKAHICRLTVLEVRLRNGSPQTEIKAPAGLCSTLETRGQFAGMLCLSPSGHCPWSLAQDPRLHVHVHQLWAESSSKPIARVSASLVLTSGPCGSPIAERGHLRSLGHGGQCAGGQRLQIPASKRGINGGALACLLDCAHVNPDTCEWSHETAVYVCMRREPREAHRYSLMQFNSQI